MIYLLISLEAVFIFTSYFGKIGLVSFIPALVYLALALTDVKMLNKKLSILVLITSIGVAVPRIFLRVGELQDEHRNRLLAEQDRYYATNERKATIQDCNKYTDWDTKGKRDCMESNRSRIEEADDHNKNLKYKFESDTKNKISLQDLAELLLFGTISITLPSAILLILFGRYEKRDKEVSTEKEMKDHKPDPKEEALRMYREGNYTIKEIVDATGVSKSTLYRILENEK
jgi:hypothetical protein